MPQIVPQDEQVLLNMLAPVSQVPEPLKQQYFLLQRCYHNGVATGPIPPALLAYLVAQSGFVSLPKPVEAKFGTVQEGAKIYWRTNEYQEENAVFLRCVEPRELGLCEIAVFGTVHRVPEAQLSLASRSEEGSDKPAEVVDEKPDTSPHSAIEPDPSPAVEAFSEKPGEPVKEAAKSLKEQLLELFPKKSVVQVAIPGEQAFEGEVESVGSGQFDGRLRIRTATGLRWVSAEHVMKETAA